MKLALVKQTAQAVKQTGKADRAAAAAPAAAWRQARQAAAAAEPGDDGDGDEGAAAGAMAPGADQAALQAALEQDISSAMQLYASLASGDCTIPAEQIFDVGLACLMNDAAAGGQPAGAPDEPRAELAPCWRPPCSCSQRPAWLPALLQAKHATQQAPREAITLDQQAAPIGFEAYLQRCLGAGGGRQDPPGCCCSRLCC
jgi:hypothetical protein